MALKRTMVHVDPDDLALIKAAAVRDGVPEAEIIRKGIHLAALATRRWDEPFTSEKFHLGGSRSRDDVREAVAGGYEAKRARNQAETPDS
ncbi:hypothetical protein [Streptomyces xinghaiensis]|uniref:hypothetical protein n=1 Tax=Streptomyces xinghaiensis TaxID=1038928 RepID=UPI0034314225